MAHRQQLNDGGAKAHARPQDPKTNTRPPGNGDRDKRDTDRGVEKIHQVSGH